MTRLVVFLLLMFFYVNIATSLNLNEYLVGKHKFFENTFSKTVNKRESPKTKLLIMEEFGYPNVTNYIKMFTFLNNTYIFTNNNIHTISENFTIQRTQSILKKVTNKGHAVFTKIITFNQTNFIITKPKQSEEIYIYKSMKNSYVLDQFIYAPNAKDAHFFINNKNLFLIVINNKEDNLARTSIYKWLGFHFDEIQTVFTTGAIKVGSFTTSAAEIVIILQDTPRRTIQTAVFEFSNEEITKIQNINLEQLIHLDTIKTGNKDFVVLYSASGNNTVYKWDGIKLVRVSEFHTVDQISISRIVNFKNISFLAISFVSEFQLYQLVHEKIILANKIEYSSKYKTILDMYVNNTGKAYIVGLDENNKVKITAIKITPSFQNIDPVLPDSDLIKNCYKNLEMDVDNSIKKIIDIKSKLNETINDNAEVIVAESLTEQPIEDKIKKLKDRANTLNTLIENYTIPNDSDNLIINSPTSFNGLVNIKQLNVNNILIKNINEHRWTPHKWLKYEEPQTISGHSKFKTVTANYVNTAKSDPIFKDILLKNEDQTFTGTTFIKYLTAHDVSAKNINDLPLGEVYVRNKPEPIQKIETPNRVHINDDNEIDLSEEEMISEDVLSSVLMALPSVFESNAIVENLEVETINGVKWEEFKDSVFRVKIDDKISGSIQFKHLQTNSLKTKQIKGINVDNLLTTSTDQIIEANMEFVDIFANELNVKTVNNIRLPEDVVFINQNETITSPVKFDEIKVLQNLTLSGKLDESFFFKDNDSHIIGTKEADLFQMYTGNVTINGNLYVSNLGMLPKSKLVVSETKIPHNLKNIYWTKNTHQKIPIHVKFLEGLSTPHLLTDVLNNINIKQYMLNDNLDKLETDFKFENVTVKGNIEINKNARHKPDFDQILKEAVLTKGSFIIHGKKKYLNSIRVENLQVSNLEGIDVSQTLNTKWQRNVTGTKTIKKLVVKNKAISKINEIKNINNVSIEDFVKKIIYINTTTANISMLDFQYLNVTNLHASKLNGNNIQDYISLEGKLNNASVIHNLRIKGNVTINHIKNMSFLNDISMAELFKNAPNQGKYGIVNETHFTGKIKVNNLRVLEVNDVNLQNLTRKTLHKHLSQTISAVYSFSNLKAENIVASKINNISITNLIDTSSLLSQKISSPKGFLLSANISMKYLTAAKILPCSLESINTELSDPSTQKWSQIKIKGNVTLLDEECFLYRLFEKTVRNNSKNIIHSEVNISSHVLMKNVNTKNLINDIDVPSLLEDAVLTNTDQEQKIVGKKWFNTLQTNEVIVLENTNATFINNHNIIALNHDIVDKKGNKVIKGKKIFFGGLQAKKFNSKTVNNVKPENIVTVNDNKVIPEAIFDTVEVRGNLNIEYYGDRNFTKFLGNRLLIEGPKTQTAKGIYYFENLEATNFTTNSINNIKVEDIVFDIDSQEISSTKEFVYPITINGNVTINYINNVNITNEYLHSIPLKGHSFIEGSVIIRDSSSINGSLTTKFINGFPVDEIKEIITHPSQREHDEIYELKLQLKEKIYRNLDLAEKMYSKFMYLEQSSILQITAPNIESASVINNNKYTIIHLNGYESGDFCGLSTNCSCPIQYILTVSPNYSVNTISDKTSQRIFSYADDTIIVNFLTGSVSSSSFCRSNTIKLLNEKSMLTWTSKSHNNTTGLLYKYDEFFTGYISKVEFFSYNGNTYVIIGRHYDPVRDTYEMDCTVMKINKTHATEIQKIPIKGVQEVFVVSTAQGIILVIGSKIPSKIPYENEKSYIFRFNSEAEKFLQLRIVPSYACSNVNALIQGSDSLIVLAHPEAPVQMLKYNPEYDNYYFYETIDLEDVIIGVSSFYTGGFEGSDAYLSLVTDQGRYYIYSYTSLEGFKLKLTGIFEGLKKLIPVEINNQIYLLAVSNKTSFLLTVVKNGDN